MTTQVERCSKKHYEWKNQCELEQGHQGSHKYTVFFGEDDTL